MDVVDLIDAVTDRLDMVGFTPATDYQRRMTSMRFCLTGVRRHRNRPRRRQHPLGTTSSGLGAALARTLGAAAVSSLILVGLLRNNLVH
uniref:Uncharacterized protein n=1 Tax=Acidithiobacillus sulfuriphilus TaxID=1867749 RepID=A0A3M8QZ58_9PROT|nr:hypothetical protein EC580_10585 [Acidithiobacillus sulfuriphilus]